MHKEVIYRETKLNLSYPADERTSFKIDGIDDFYTIIEVASVGDRIFAVLESNTLGEDSMQPVFLGKSGRIDMLTIQKLNSEKIDTNLNEKAEKVIFIKSAQRISDTAYDSLAAMLEEEFGYDKNEIIEWDDEDVNKNPILSGGNVR